MRVDELLVELATDKLRRRGLLEYDVGDAEVVVVSDDAEKLFRFVVVAARIKERPLSIHRPSGKGTGCLSDILFGVMTDAHGEKFEELSRVVFVGFPLFVEAPIEKVEHWRDRYS